MSPSGEVYGSGWNRYGQAIADLRAHNCSLYVHKREKISSLDTGLRIQQVACGEKTQVFPCAPFHMYCLQAASLFIVITISEYDQERKNQAPSTLHDCSWLHLRSAILVTRQQGRALIFLIRGSKIFCAAWLSLKEGMFMHGVAI